LSYSHDKYEYSNEKGEEANPSEPTKSAKGANRGEDCDRNGADKSEYDGARPMVGDGVESCRDGNNAGSRDENLGN
jgi:hypothetical protein